MADFDALSDFAKSGPHRLKDAEELMEPPTADAARSDAATRHLRGAMYLAGYAVECLLKAYLIQQEGCRYLSDAQQRINARRQSAGKEPIRDIARTASGHSLGYLLGLTDLESQQGFDVKLWGRLTEWKPAWRYDPAPSAPDAARAFLEDVRAALRWVQPRISYR